MTVWYNTRRKHWMYNFKVGGKRYSKYCISKTGVPARTEKQARAIETVERNERRKGHRLSWKDDGYLYFLMAGDLFVKIGWSAYPNVRVKGLQGNCPLHLELLGTVRGTMAEEQELHRRLSAFNVRQEWFRADPAVLDLVNDRLAKSESCRSMPLDQLAATLP